MAFPTSPSNNQIALVNGIEYYYNSTKGAWYRYGDATANVITSNTFQVLSSITFADGTSQTTAGVAVDSYARSTANTASNNITILQGVDATQNTNITAVNNFAASAYNKANTAITTSGGSIVGSLSISQDLTVSGNLTVLGNSTTITTTTLDVGDPLIYLANNNLTSDTVDIGIIGHYNDGANAHTGIIRDPSLKEWIFFKGYTPEVQSNNLINIADPSFAYANVYASYFKGNVISNGVNLYTYLQGIDATQNTNITAVNNYAASAYGSSNTNSTNITYVNQYAVSAYAAANTNTSDISIIQGVNTTQNNNITYVNQYAASAYASSNTNATNISIMQGVNTTQNTNITAADAKAQAAFDKANTGTSGGGSVLTSTVDPFTGNGSQTAFTLSVTPSSINYTTAVVGGVNQPKTAYSVVGTTLTFTSAPANGQLIEVTTLTTSNSDIYTVNNIISPFLLMGA